MYTKETSNWKEKKDKKGRSHGHNKGSHSANSVTYQ
jgi:hypothetical protein